MLAARTRWVTFDCFGTLVDWHTGFERLLEPVAGAKTQDLARAYHQCERLAEADRPHRSYKEVLRAALTGAAADLDMTLTPCQVDSLVRGWGSLPLFPDVERMLRELREMGCRIGVLTNCDDDLFEETHRLFELPFDLVVTAAQVCDYKPSLSHFRFFDRLSAAGVGDWIHVACSWYHDIVPARKLGIRSVWLDRDDTGEEPGMATVRVRSALDVPGAVARLW